MATIGNEISSFVEGWPYLRDQFVLKECINLGLSKVALIEGVLIVRGSLYEWLHCMPLILPIISMLLCPYPCLLFSFIMLQNKWLFSKYASNTIIGVIKKFVLYKLSISCCGDL